MTQKIILPERRTHTSKKGINKGQANGNYKPADERFLEKIDTNDCNGCHIWKGGHSGKKKGKGKKGLPAFYVNGKNVIAYRYVWERIHGKIPDKKQINHRCNNPSCVNIDHLVLGTPQENMDYCIECGRIYRPKGKLNVFYKGLMTYELADIIRERVKSGDRQCDIAKEVGISRAQVCLIVNNKQWVSSS